MKNIPEEFKNRVRTRPIVGFLCRIVPAMGFYRRTRFWPFDEYDDEIVLVLKSHLKNRQYGRSMCLVFASCKRSN